MKRERGRYYVGDRICDRAWRRKGTVTSVPKNQGPLSRLGVDWDDKGPGEGWVPGIMLDPKYVEKLVKKMDKSYWVPQKGERIRIPSIGIKGTVEFVDTNNLFFNHFYPIQVLLDKPHDDSGQRMFRTNLKDIEKVKKKDKDKKKVKKKEKPAPPPPVEDDDILWDDDEMEWD